VAHLASALATFTAEKGKRDDLESELTTFVTGKLNGFGVDVDANSGRENGWTVPS
jgi:hypothetical protein